MRVSKNNESRVYGIVNWMRTEAPWRVLIWARMAWIPRWELSTLVHFPRATRRRFDLVQVCGSALVPSSASPSCLRTGGRKSPSRLSPSCRASRSAVCAVCAPSFPSRRALSGRAVSGEATRRKISFDGGARRRRYEGSKTHADKLHLGGGRLIHAVRVALQGAGAPMRGINNNSVRALGGVQACMASLAFSAVLGAGAGAGGPSGGTGAYCERDER